MMRHALAALLAALAAGPEPAPAPMPAPAAVAWVVRPDEQLARVLALFEGARAPHPAAALAAWRRATGDHEGLSKAAQALIALLNPEMVPELRRLDGAAVALESGPGGGWRATIPRDDGTFAALAAAMALTDGAAEPLLAGAAVDRLGPIGAPLMARRPDGALAVAPDRDALARALARLDAPAPVPGAASGWHVRLDPAAVPPDLPLPARRAAAGLAAAGCRTLEATAALEGETFAVDVRAAFAGPAPGAGAAIDPAWLDSVPADAAGARVVAAVVLALDPGRDGWDRLFAAADRVEKADPARAQAAPLRARLDLAALAAGVRPERDLYPHLKGLTAFWTAAPAGWGLVLHAADDAGAARMLDRVAVPLAGRLGAVAPVRLGRAVLLASSAPLRDAALSSAAGRAPSEAPALRGLWADRSAPPARIAAAWPGRLDLSGPLAAGLDGAPPIAWVGGADGASTWDRLRWPGLRGVVRRALEHLPQAPADAGRD